MCSTRDLSLRLTLAKVSDLQNIVLLSLLLKLSSLTKCSDMRCYDADLHLELRLTFSIGLYSFGRRLVEFYLICR